MATTTRTTTKTNGAQLQNQPGVQPVIAVTDVDQAVRLYKQFGFTPFLETPGPDNKIVHAILQHGTTFVHVAQLGAPGSPDPEWERASTKGPRGLGLQFYVMVEDVDAAFKTAQKGGLTIVAKPKDQFWGDRSFTAKDPFGYVWNFAQHVRDVPPEELAEAAAAATAAAR